MTKGERILTVIIIPLACVMAFLWIDREFITHNISKEKINFVLERQGEGFYINAEEKSFSKRKYRGSLVVLKDSEKKELYNGCKPIYWDEESNILYGTYRISNNSEERVPFYIGEVKKINGKLIPVFPKGTLFSRYYGIVTTLSGAWHLKIKLPSSLKELTTVRSGNGKGVVKKPKGILLGE